MMTERFYLGKLFDIKENEITETQLLYDPDDLTTHAVVVGMTGSGKTGLCIGMLEEAALNDIPAVMIDPKGDITNALLHFPELRSEDFQPWVNPDEARRDGKTVEQAGTDVAQLWHKGLADWGIDKERIEALSEAADFAVYTPGSDAGIPISILTSLKVPEIPWDKNKEMLREKISATVTALLGLVGLKDIDPVRSKEHILLSNIFENAWIQGMDLDLSELILQTQNPPFDKLGVFDVGTFFPDAERSELAMLLNNILAAPAFKVWIEGHPLDIPSLMYSPDGRPRHSVFYIAHLPDSERMFFVTLLFSAIETWMRTLSGSSSLRSIVYFDEIFGFMPPTANPPSKEPMLRMLKQARAFGIGMVLVTQNPVDIDYKGLSNAGSWFVGKLQTDQDKQRLLDGLESATGGEMDRRAYDQLISKLGKRVFLMHNVHEKKPAVFYTRWAMNYLAGPLTRAQIPALNALVGAQLADKLAKPSPVKTAGVSAEERTAPMAMLDDRETAEMFGTLTRPAVPSGFEEYFLPNNLTISEAYKTVEESPPDDAISQGLFYRPVILAQAELRFQRTNLNLNYDKKRTALVVDFDRRGGVNWDEFEAEEIDVKILDRDPLSEARFSSLEGPLADAKTLRSLEKDFQDWVYRNTEIVVRANEKLKVFVGPEINQADFRKRCAEVANESLAAESKKVTQSYDKKVKTLLGRLKRERRELAEDEAELSQRKLEEVGTHAENVLSLFTKRKRRLSTSLTKRRLTEQARADVEESLAAIEDFEKQIKDLEQEKNDALEDLQNKWIEIADDVIEIPVSPYKKDIRVDLFGIAWTPYYIVHHADKLSELPAYG